MSRTFPTDFAWGVATSAHQIEGAFTADGRGPSVWDHHRTRTGETAAVANDHYHRYEEDLDLLVALGIRHYRLSIAWPRILPTGTGAVNAAGLGFYDRLIDACLARGIRPHVTLYHWDHPQALEERYGGFRSRRMADDLADYATVVVRHLGDRVTDWFTLNEIACVTNHSYTVGPPSIGTHAPAVQVGSQQAIHQTIHHALLAHGRMTQAIRAATPRPCRVALVDNTAATVPLTETPADIAAARAAFPSAWLNGLLLWPVLTGRWSPAWEAAAGAAGTLPIVEPGDFAVIHQPLDALGLNVYSGTVVRAADTPSGFQELPFPAAYPRLAMPWLRLVPEAMYWLPRFLREAAAFRGDLVITENGCAAEDELTPQGEVLDLDRIHYLRQHLGQLHRAVAEGYPVRGYFLWSFLDNFEWSWGFAKRFGIVWTSFGTQERIPKASARWYAEVIRANGVV